MAISNIIYPVYEEPEAKPKVDPGLLVESIICRSCQGGVPILRLHPRVSKFLLLAKRHSSYKPQPLQYCSCKSLGVLVDHRGNPRVYMDDANGWYLLNHQFPSPIIPTTFLKIPYLLLDGPRPLRPSLGAFIHKDSMTELRDYFTYQGNLPAYIPVPTTDYVAQGIAFYRRYAVQYKVIVLFPNSLALPDGRFLPRPKHIPSSQLSEYYQVETIKYHRFAIDILHHLRSYKPENCELILEPPKVFSNKALSYYAHKANRIINTFRTYQKQSKDKAHKYLDSSPLAKPLAYLHFLRQDLEVITYPPKSFLRCPLTPPIMYSLPQGYRLLTKPPPQFHTATTRILSASR